MPLVRDVASAEEIGYEVLRAQWPDWEPADGDPLTMVVRAGAAMVADLTYLASRQSEESFRFYGRTVAGVLPVDDTPATGTVTFTAQDVNGPYVIPEGTEVSGAGPTGEGVGFQTVTELTIANGSTTGSVAVEALLDGTGGNDISGTAELEEFLDYIVSAEFDAPTAGGTEREADRDYLDRLAETERLADPKPVQIEEFATMARLLGAYRATAINGLDPTDDSTGNILTVAIAMIVESGEEEAEAADIVATIDSQREQNFVVHGLSPTYTTIGVAWTATAYPGWDTAVVEAAGNSALAQHLSPAYWGSRQDTGEVREWLNRTTVRYLEVAEALQRVEGLDHVDSLSLFYFREDFSGDLSAYTFDAGPATFSAAGGLGVPTDTTEKRFTRTGLVVPDPRGTVKYSTGATVGAGGSTDIVLAWLSEDDFLIARVSNADSKLSVRKVISEVGSEIAADAGTFTALANNTTYWARAWITGNVVTVEHWTTNPALGGSPAKTFSTTLAGGDATAYGTSVSAGVGLRAFPGSATWRYDDLHFDTTTDDIALAGHAPLPRAGAISGVVAAGT